MADYHLTPRAQEHLETILEYIADRNASAARRMTDEFFGRFRYLADNPGACVETPDFGNGMRRSVLKENYLIFYRQTDEMLEILHIIHASRDVDGYFRGLKKSPDF